MQKFTLRTIALLFSLAILLSGCSSLRLKQKEPITLTVWHVYGSQTESPFNALVDDFNRTVGAESGVYVNVTCVTNSTEMDNLLTASLEEYPGALPLPDLFTSYPRIVEKFEETPLLDWSRYFSEEELSAFRQEFLAEGYFDDALLMLPIAKSSETLFLNKTLFDRFADDAAVSRDCFSTMEQLADVCNLYYERTDGKTLLQIDDYYYYFLSAMTAMGDEFIIDGKINAASDAFAAAFAPIARAAIRGGLCVGEGYASDRWKTGEILCSVGSTAGILYQRDYVTYEDNTRENIETQVLPYPCLSGEKKAVVQRGGGLFALRSDDERKNEAAALFAKWITEPQHNLAFVTAAGYLPVTDEAFSALFDNLDSVKIEKYRLLYSAVKQQFDDGYSFCTQPQYAGAYELQQDFETLIRATFSQMHKEYLLRSERQSDRDALTEELSNAALAQLRAALR